MDELSDRMWSSWLQIPFFSRVFDQCLFRRCRSTAQRSWAGC